ncbi:bifunctional folylpolyglutamate synthase/dihydrofolate synthase [Lachnospiraceae bacterium LCP25S3_G4]
MNYQDAVEYILGIQKFTKKHDENHTVEFLKRLGVYESTGHIIHVAGTNGKGSVCAYLQALLLADHKDVGMFTSPHLVNINERIRINGMDISDEEFLVCFQRTLDVVKQMEQDGIAHPTFFEFLVGMAMVAFQRSHMEYIILETGLGGRLDATNAFLKPLLTVITSISKDHTAILGDTIEQIAKEKAGIIKKNVPVIFDGNNGQSAQVIRQRADFLHAPCREITKNAYEIKEIKDKHIAFLSLNAYYEYTTWQLSNPGLYQVDNAMLALEAMAYIKKASNQKPKIEHYRQAMEAVHWEGRLEEVCKNMYVDGAHNIGAIERFVETIQEVFKKREVVILFSAVQDKEYESMIAYLCKHIEAKAYIITAIRDIRATKTEELSRIFQTYTDRKVIIKETLSEAWMCAKEEKGNDGVVYCIGSLYLVGMIKELIAGGNIHA